MRWFRLILVLALSLSFPLWGQGSGRIQVRTYETPQGLGAPYSHTLAQDYQGFVYVGAGEGLFKGDGTRFEHVPIPGTEVLRGCLVTDEKGPVWVGTTQGLFRLAPGESTFERVQGGLPEEPLQQLGRDRSGRIWALVGGRPFVEHAPRQFSLAPGWPRGERAVFLSAWPTQATVYALTRGTLFVFDAASSMWRSEETPVLEEGDQWREVAQDGSGQVWMTSRMLLWRKPVGADGWIDMRRQTGLRYVTSMVPSATGSLWITGRFGVVRALGEIWDPLPLSERVPSNQVRTTLVDWDGNLWIAGGGLHLVLGLGRVRSYTPAHGLPAQDAWGVVSDHQGRLWVTTGGGLSVSQPTGWRTVVPGESLSAVAVAPDGAIWAGGGEDGSLFRVDPTSLAVERIKVLPKRDGSFARGFAFLGREVWVCSLLHGPWVGVREGGRWQWRHVEPPQRGKDSLTSLTQDREGRIYLAGSNNLHIFHQGHWLALPNRVKGHAYVSVLDHKGDLWVASFLSTELEHYRWTPTGPQHVGTLPIPSLQQGMHMYSAAADQEGFLWIITTQGVLKVDLARGSVVARLTKSDGLPSNDINRGGLHLSPAGDLWVATSFGLGRFIDYRNLPPITLRMPRLSRIQYPSGVQPMPPRDLVFTPSQRTLVWHFGVPSYAIQERLIYEARLDESPTWLRLEQPAMGISGLSPGPHRLRIRAILPEGLVSPVTTFDFVMLPHWWERVAVRLLGVLGLAGMIGLGLGLHLRRVHRHNQLLERVVASRTADLRALNADLREARDLVERTAKGRSAYIASMNHELRNPLNSILLYTELMLDPSMDPTGEASREAFTKIRASGLKVQGLIGSILEMAKLEAGIIELRQEPIDLTFLLEELRVDMQDFLQEHRGELEIQTPYHVEACRGDHDKVRFALQVLVRTLGSQGAQGQIRLRLSESGNLVQFEIRDEGPGLTPEQLQLLFLDFSQDWAQRSIPWHPAALELTIARRFVEMMDGRLDVESQPGRCTRFLLALPVAQG